ncbi:PhzF family phenazine biosynthesis protein [Puniceicoccales bacterium CK1056]|uniref:PhzF family phenazine biosynthesis protein n=1 Tax=Oceanipulchritudo coccoides TaxID=2706888 RepID=A0A6B2M0Q4_9BACT|nr:PhzF family phenazine biosynthesis protein [Oceanipulchritudo coccoides]NDV61936.1 PhzF family phenazine biosynthesis protein [Oceanipulchritudo coccoides]
MKLPLYQIDAFAEKPFQGNPAAVCPLDRWLPDETLQAIAEENNLSETAFYVKEGEIHDLRWFTPTKEVDLCGHATLAAAYVIFETTGSDLQKITFHSKSGPLHVSRMGDLLELDFPLQTGVECEAPPELIEGLGQVPSKCFRAKDYMAVYETEACVNALSPDFAKLKELDLRGVIVTAPGNSSDFVSRFFTPNFGIDEDPVTGSAHCTLTPYWAKRLGKNELRAIQISKRTGHLRCSLKDDRVLISGRAIPYLKGSINF